jgi:hypothetical protein
MLRHVREKHGDLKRCTELGCAWKGKRTNRLTDHKEKKHGFKMGSIPAQVLVLQLG